MGTVYYRKAVTTTNVKLRELDLVAVPYDEPASVLDRDFRPDPYVERISPGAFSHRPIRPNRVPLLRDHELGRTIGHCRAVHVNRPDGLHATVKVSRTALGDESLELAADGSLHVSIGMTVDPIGDRWNAARDTVTRTRCGLVEISLVPIQAYDGADVIAVRTAAGLELPDLELELPDLVTTPRLDAVRAFLAARV